MAKQAVKFTVEAAKKIVEHVRNPHGSGGPGQSAQGGSQTPTPLYIAKLKADISGSTGVNLESGSVEIWRMTTGGVLEYTSEDVTAYNIGTQDRQQDSLIKMLRDPISGQFFFGEGGGGVIFRFELTSALVYNVPGSTAYANLLDENEATIENVEVKDTTGSHYGPIGAQGWCILMSDSGLYEVMFVESPARFIGFTLSEDMGETQAGRASISSGYGFWGATPNAIDITVTHVYDPYSMYATAKSGHKGIAVYNEKVDQYGIVELPLDASTAFWGKANADSAVAGGDTVVSVTVQVCSDVDGTGAAGASIKVWLPEVTNRDRIQVTSGDVISFMPTSDGEYVCVSDYTIASSHIKLTMNWEEQDGDKPYCKGNPSNYNGSTVDATQEWTAYLECDEEAFSTIACPNLVKDEVVVVQWMEDGTLAVTSKYMDDHIGAVKQTTSGDNPDPVNGWGLMDGEDNKIPKGSGLDMRGRFVRGWDASEPDDDTIIDDNNTIGDTDGHDELDIDDHGVDEQDFTSGEGIRIVNPAHTRNPGATASPFDIRPAFGVMKYIERLNNQNAAQPAQNLSGLVADNPLDKITIDPVTDNVEVINNRGG